MERVLITVEIVRDDRLEALERRDNLVDKLRELGVIWTMSVNGDAEMIDRG